MSESSLRELQRSVDALVGEALSDDVDLEAVALQHVEIDETERVMIYVRLKIPRPPGLPCMPEALLQLIDSIVLQELQRRDVLAGRDPSARITSDHRYFLADYLSKITAGWQDELETRRRWLRPCPDVKPPRWACFGDPPEGEQPQP